MNSKTKMSNLESYQELSIQIAILTAKVDKILNLLEPEIYYEVASLESTADYDLTKPYGFEFK